MMFIFTKKAEKTLQKLPIQVQNLIIATLRKIKNGEIKGRFRTLINLLPATHRLRIWDYRLILQKEGNSYFILDLWHRQSIYKD